MAREWRILRDAEALGRERREPGCGWERVVEREREEMGGFTTTCLVVVVVAAVYSVQYVCTIGQVFSVA